MCGPSFLCMFQTFSFLFLRSRPSFFLFFLPNQHWPQVRRSQPICRRTTQNSIYFIFQTFYQVNTGCRRVDPGQVCPKDNPKQQFVYLFYFLTSRHWPQARRSRPSLSKRHPKTAVRLFLFHFLQNRHWTHSRQSWPRLSQNKHKRFLFHF